MKLLRAWLGALPGYLWSGWGAIASLLLSMALWEALATWYGSLVLPTPRPRQSHHEGFIDHARNPIRGLWRTRATVLSGGRR